MFNLTELHFNKAKKLDVEHVREGQLTNISDPSRPATNLGQPGQAVLSPGRRNRISSKPTPRQSARKTKEATSPTSPANGRASLNTYLG